MTTLTTYQIQATYDSDKGGFVCVAPPGKIVEVSFTPTSPADGIYLVTVSEGR